MSEAFFITGTDTGIGKTFITCAFIELMKSHNKISAGMKPVAAGEDLYDGVSINSDVFDINHFSNANISIDSINSYSYKEAVAPHIAAKNNNHPICLSKIKDDFNYLMNNTDYLFVEGAGGYYVPLDEKVMTSDLVRFLNIPIILVVGIRLGCLNHTLLTIEAIEKNNQKIFGWVANVIDKDMSYKEDNINYLQNRIGYPCIGIVPYIPNNNPVDASQYLIWPGP